MFSDTDKLLVWQKAHELVLRIYEITNNFPDDEIYGLISQIRRASISIPSNIVEGKARGSNKDYKRFLLISRGSLEEVRYQVLLSKDLKYIDYSTWEKLNELIDEVGKLLNGLIRALDGR